MKKLIKFNINANFKMFKRPGKDKPVYRNFNMLYWYGQ
jgi:hypothetical protein